MSMIGLAASPGTDVDPVCSSSTTRSPSAVRILSAARRKSSGHCGSYSTIRILPSGAMAAGVLSTAPRADAAKLIGRNVQEFQEFLVFVGRAFLELFVPSTHIGFTESGGLHDGHPFLFRHHGNAPLLCAL